MDDLSTFQEAINLYNKLIKYTLQERQYLINIDTRNLANILEEKKDIIEKIECLVQQLKILIKNPIYVGYSSKLTNLAKQLIFHNSINAKIAQQHLAFSTAMLNFYTSFIQINQTYNNKATISYRKNLNDVR